MGKENNFGKTAIISEIISTGIIRELDDSGRFCIPREIRRSNKLQDNQKMEVFIYDGMICLKPYADGMTTKSMITDLMMTIEANEENGEIKKRVGSKLKEAAEIISNFEEKKANAAGEN